MIFLLRRISGGKARELHLSGKIIDAEEAGCSLADNCTAPLFKARREAHPAHKVITNINSSAEVKAISDINVTSSNAEKIIWHIPEDKQILFAPDRNLGRYLMKKTGRKMELWQHRTKNRFHPCYRNDIST